MKTGCAGHRQVTLVRQVVIHVLTGGLHVTAGDDGRDLGPGSLMALAPGLLHSVRAVVASEMLLTIHKVRSSLRK